MENLPQQNAFRSLLKNEITWVIMIIVGVMGFVKTVVIPINNLQLNLIQVQQSITENNETTTKTLADLSSRTTRNSNDIIELKTLINLKK